MKWKAEVCAILSVAGVAFMATHHLNCAAGSFGLVSLYTILFGFRKAA